MKIPLIMKYHFFPVIHVVANHAVEMDVAAGNEIEQGLNTTVHVEPSKNSPLDYQVTLEIKTEVIPDKPHAYTMELASVGFFEVEKDFPEDQREALVATMGASLLYGAAREFLLMLTSRGPYPAIYLPTITFMQPNPAVPTTSEGKDADAIETKPKRKSHKR